MDKIGRRRKRLVDSFISLVEIDSESGEEGRVHQFLKEKMNELNVSYCEDNSMIDTNLAANNLIARISEIF